MACNLNYVQYAWTGDNTTIQVDFYRDRQGKNPRTFASGVTVNWRIVSADGSTLVDTFTGARDASVTNRLYGTITSGAPAAGNYTLFAEVTDDGDVETLPTSGEPRLTLSVSADPVPSP